MSHYTEYTNYFLSIYVSILDNPLSTALAAMFGNVTKTPSTHLT